MIDKGGFGIRLLIGAATVALMCLLATEEILAQTSSTSYACVVPADKAATGHVLAMHDLPGGAVLIGAVNGLFRFDPAAGRVVPVPAGKAATGLVYNMHDLPGGAVLIGAVNGLFRFEPAAGRVAPVPAVSGLIKLQ